VNVPEGFFTQAATILFEGSAPFDAIATSLAAFLPTPHDPAAGADGWMLGGRGLLLPFRPEVNGYALVDIVSHRWPDDMGDPKHNPMVFSAWTMGHFGPCTYPGGLARAMRHLWGWWDGTDLTARHRTFVRIRTSYVFGATDSTPVLPPGYDPITELLFVTDIASAILTLPGALGYFNPSGEALRSPLQVRADLSRHHAGGPLPLDLWSNVRFFRVEEAERGTAWASMDTVGMSQLDLPDLEARFGETVFGSSEVHGFLRNLSMYLLENRPLVSAGDTVDGPRSSLWRASEISDALAAPPRPVIRWTPV
jgi:hypothetical protein